MIISEFKKFKLPLKHAKPHCRLPMRNGSSICKESPSGRKDEYAMNADCKQELSERLLKWVSDAVHPQAAVQSIHRLHGGMSSIVHSIVLQVNGVETKVVLRQVDNAEWLFEEPDLTLHEAESLRLAEQTAVSTPRILAYDMTGDDCGMTALLMTHVGGPVVLQPPSMEPWLEGLAETLAQIHKVKADHFRWTYFTYKDV